MPNAKITGNIVGKKIKIAREKLGLGQVEVSAALEVDYKIYLSQRLISEIENERRPVRDKELYAIAKILNTDPNWLLS